MIVSVITINYNNREGLEKTISSVINQNYKGIEYIVIDGGSSDGSAELIKSKARHFKYFVSESDKGIYDAMNKGITQATGDYLLFLNSGDCLVNNELIKAIVSSNPKEDIVYGNAWITGRSAEPIYKIMPKVLDPKTLLTFTITHQCIFFRKDLFERAQYDLNYTIIADWVFVNNAIILHNASYKHLNIPVVYYDGTGYSSMKSHIDNREFEREKYFKEIAPYVLKDFLKSVEIEKSKRRRISRVLRIYDLYDRVMKKIGIN